MKLLIMTMTKLNTIPGGKLLRKHILTGDVLFAVWFPSLHRIWRTSISLALSLCISTWIIPHGLNVTNATPNSIYSVAPGNPCKLSEINISFVHFFAADSFRPFILCVLVDLPPPFNVCSFRLCCVSLALLCCVLLALKMARKKLCPRTPKKKKKSSCHGGRPPAIPTAAAPRPCGASDTEYIGNWQSPPQPKSSINGMLKDEECPGRMALLGSM